MGLILILPSDTWAEAVFQRALTPPHAVRTATNLAEMEALLAETEPRACIVDLFDPPPPIPPHVILALRHAHPSVAFVAASVFKGREMELYRLGRMNVDGVIRMEAVPAPREILAVVDGALATCLAARTVRAVADHLPLLPQKAIRWAIEHAGLRPQVSQLAAALGVSSKVLSREMTSGGLCPPRNLLLWGRLIRATDLLERDGETVESVAFHLGYSTGGALGKALKQQVGCSPTDLLERGGLGLVLDVFRRQGLGSAGWRIEP